MDKITSYNIVTPLSVSSRSDTPKLVPLRQTRDNTMTNAPLAETCERSFMGSYVSTYESLNSAKAMFDNGRRKLALDALSPEKVRSCVFWNRLTMEVRDVMKALYDASITSSDGLLGLLYHCAVEYQTTTYVTARGINRYHLCDFQAGKLPQPETQAGWDKLLCFTQSLVHSRKLNAKALHARKGTKTRLHQGSSMSFQNFLTTAVEKNNQVVLGALSACFVWMLETKNMNKAYEAQNSAAGSMRYNTSTLLCRRMPEPEHAPVQSIPEPEPEAAEESTSDDDVTPDDWEEVENWEDLVL